MITRFGVIPHGVFAAVMALVMTGTTATAWHWETDTPSELLESRAGDARIIEDGRPCFDATRALENTTCAVLYPHVWQPFTGWSQTMNLVRPADCIEDLARGFTGDPAVLHSDSRAQVSIKVEAIEYYNRFECGDDTLMAAESGLHPPIDIDPRVNMTAYWYLSADLLEVTPLGFGAGNNGPAPSMGSLPCVTVEMVLSATYHGGTRAVLGQGRTTKTVVSGPTDDVMQTSVPDPCPGSAGTVTVENVTEFQVDLGRTEATLAAEVAGLRWEVAWYHEAPGLPEEMRVVPVQWNLHTGPEHTPRLLVPIEKSLESSSSCAVLDPAGRLHLCHLVTSPWGEYDVDRGNMRFLLHDNEGRQVPIEHVLPRKYDDHGPLNITTPWDIEKESLEPGLYTLTVTFTNWQHTVDANLTARIEVTQDSIVVRTEDGIQVQIGGAALEEHSLPTGGILVAVLLALGVLLPRRPERGRRTASP